MTGEVRTTSKTGGQKGVKRQRYDLLPKQGLDAIAELFGYGATKYADHNWRNRYEFSKSIAALERHTQAFKDGETYDLCPPTCPDVDEEVCREHSRIEHLAAVGFHTLVLLTWLRTDGEGLANDMDDRWPHTLERARIAREEALQAERDEMVASGRLTESMTVTLTQVPLETLALAIGTDVQTLKDAQVEWKDPEPRSALADLEASERLLDALEYGGVRPTSPSRGLVYGGEIPVEDLRM